MLNQKGFSVIEFIVAVGAFALVMGMGFTLLSSGRLSVQTTEALIRAEEHAIVAFQRMNRDLRLSNAGRVFIHDGLGGPMVNAPNPGKAIYLQIPLGSYEQTLNLNADNTLRWGSADSEGEFIVYYLNANTGDLLRASCAAAGDATLTSSPEIIATGISAVNFSQATAGAQIVNIEIISEGKAGNRTHKRTLRLGLRLRN